MQEKWYDNFPFQLILASVIFCGIEIIINSLFTGIPEIHILILIIILIIVWYRFRTARNKTLIKEQALDFPGEVTILTQLHRVMDLYTARSLNPISYSIVTKYTHPQNGKIYYFQSRTILKEYPSIINSPISRIKKAANNTTQEHGGIPVKIDDKGKYTFCESPIFHVEKLSGFKQALGFAAYCLAYLLVAFLVVLLIGLLGNFIKTL